MGAGTQGAEVFALRPLRPWREAQAEKNLTNVELVKIVGGLGGEVGAVEGLDGGRFNVDDAFDVLQATSDAERGFTGDDEAAALKEVGAHDGVGDAGLVFEADEDNALGRAGTLAADHRAGDEHSVAVAGEREVGGAPRSGEAVADRCHRVRASGQADGGEIGVVTLGARHRGEGCGCGVVDDTCVQERFVGGPGGGDLPEGGAAVGGEAIQGAEGGEGPALGGGEMSAAQPVVEGFEGLLPVNCCTMAATVMSEAQLPN